MEERLSSILEQYNPYDNGAKRLITLCAQDLISWLHKKAVFKNHGTGEFKSVTFEADAAQLCTIDNHPAIIHLEIQSGGDANMEQRLLEYNTLAYRYYRHPALSYVIYLRTGGKRPKPPLVRVSPDGKEILRFHYETLELGEMRCEDLFEKNLRGLLPLIPLCENGARREVVEHIIALLTTNDDTMTTRELLALTSLFASLAFTSSEDQQWLDRRFKMLDDILRETPMYKSIERRAREEALVEGREKGREEGREEGREKGHEEERQLRLSSLRQKLLMLQHKRFPQLSQLASKRVAQITRPDILEDLMVKLALAQDSDEAQEALLALAQNDQANTAS